jgi:hypothetical protein
MKYIKLFESTDDKLRILNIEDYIIEVLDKYKSNILDYIIGEYLADPNHFDLYSTQHIIKNGEYKLKDEIYENIRCSESIKIHEVNIMKDYLNMSSEASGKTLKYSPDMFKFIISHPYLLHYAKFNKVVRDKVDELYKEVDGSKKVSEQYKEEYKGICMTVKAITQLY